MANEEEKKVFFNTCRFSAIYSADFLQYLQIFCNACTFSAKPCRFSAIPADFLQNLQIFCKTCTFSATLLDFLHYLHIFCNTADFLQHSAGFLQYLEIFYTTCIFSATLCRFSATFCGFSAMLADFLEHSADFPQYLQIFCNTLRNFCRASSDDINSCTAQRSLVVLFLWLLMVFFARLKIYPNFIRSQPRAHYVTSMPLLSKAI